MGIHAHNQIKGDKGKHEGVSNNIENAYNTHSLSAPLGIIRTSRPQMMQKSIHLPMRLNGVHFEFQGVVKVGKTQPVKNEEPYEVSPKKKGQIEPDLFAVQIFVQPGEDVVFSEKKDEKEAK